MNQIAMTDKSILAPDSLGPTVSIGEILVEIMAKTPGHGFLERLDMTGPFASGAPAIFIAQCARIGGSAGLIGAVGDDDFGRLNTARLQRDGADVSAISVDAEYPTGSAFVRYRTDGSRDFVYNIAHSAAARIGWTAAVEALVARAGHLHVMGTVLAMPGAWEIIERAAAFIIERGGSVSLDPNLRKELAADGRTTARLDSLIAISDLLLPSGDELERAAGVDGEDRALSTLFERGVGEVVLKRGAGGASFFASDGARVDASAFRVEELDPTGAGDCFGGAYVACRRLGMNAADALRYANAAGARNVTFRGPMEGAGTRSELDEFIRNTPTRPG
ncbi:MAG: sugar kinase [Salinisphaera sp.]